MQVNRSEQRKQSRQEFLCSLRFLLLNSGRGVLEIGFSLANSEGVNIYSRRDGDADFKFLAFRAEVGLRRARDTAPSFYNNPTIHEPIPPCHLLRRRPRSQPIRQRNHRQLRSAGIARAGILDFSDGR